MAVNYENLDPEKILEIELAKKNQKLVNRDKTVSVRFTKEEFRKINDLAIQEELTKSNYLRSLIFEKMEFYGDELFKHSERLSKKPSYVDPELLRHVAKIGNNINQIAKVLNSANINGQTLELLELIHVLSEIDEHLKKLLMMGVESSADQIS